MEVFPVRLMPGQDLKAGIDSLARLHDWPAACILSAVGSLTRVSLRFADREEVTIQEGHFEILTLSGSVSREGSHLHLSVADETGDVSGGHLKEGAVIYTTAELVIGILPGWEFTREPCPRSGYPELVVRRTGSGEKPGGED